MSSALPSATKDMAIPKVTRSNKPTQSKKKGITINDDVAASKSNIHAWVHQRENKDKFRNDYCFRNPYACQAKLDISLFSSINYRILQKMPEYLWMPKRM
ncbi:hypothetical protein H5410_056959 [Solanum commersonii]|uniref:Uncharacterized protein n=1 Tax=Solanum commersonii TaxID=4109 RepID=A0A9J5WLM4_SOLCO|nr:hypothetical protein H5410_056959 [Solanum commersonii]